MPDQPPPLDFDDGDLFAVPKPKPPATRQDDHPTSSRAAAKVAAAQETIKARVLRFAKEAGADGFIDADLLAKFPDSPESSHRKRRTELTTEGLIVDSGRTRTNDHGNAEVVWLHREFHHGPVRPHQLPQAEWDAVMVRLAARADEVNSWATQAHREGRSAWARGLTELAQDLRLLKR
jgi:hypothetical protein